MSKNKQEEWNTYCNRTLVDLTPILTDLGFTLDAEQPHVSGERYLMQAATGASGKKIILLGKRLRDDKRVVIKATQDTDGAQELEHQRICHAALNKIDFAYKVFLSPEEVLFTTRDGFTIAIHEYLAQEIQFIDRPLEQQFTLALKAFKAQESAHATTYNHRRLIEKTFGNKEVADYLNTFETFRNELTELLPERNDIHKQLQEAMATLKKNSTTIDQYSSFLTHIDFVPHNFRIIRDDIYLLDHSSLCFGNKYEGWARFVNFMELYNPKLARLLVEYVRDNRSPEEIAALRLMRIYKLGEIMWYYSDKCAKSSGDLLKLNTARVQLWNTVLQAVLQEENVLEDIIDTYKKTRDSLRSEEEKRRQIGLH